MTDTRLQDALNLLNLHYESFNAAEPYATITGHPVPSDTRGWSQVLVSVLTGVEGRGREKGSDLRDGSDVKGANTWQAIDTPRFNGVIKAGTQSSTSGRMASLDAMPNLYLVLWDETTRETARCRVWAVRPQKDPIFRAMCRKWYAQRIAGDIKSNNFQLHPPRGLDNNIIRNTCGNLVYPLYFSVERSRTCGYELTSHNPNVLISGSCARVTSDT